MDYCSKDNRFWEHESLPGPSRASTTSDRSLEQFAEEFKETVQAGKPLIDLLDHYPLYSLMYGHRFLQSYHAFVASHAKVRGSVLCIWLSGPTCTGKSTTAHSLFPNAYVKDPSTIFLYLQQTDVIFEDFGFNFPPITNLLWWFSHFKCIVQIKGGHTALHVRRFIVTSNYTIDQIFGEEPLTRTSHVTALKRRLK